MVHPYKQMYLSDAMQNLAEAFYMASNVYEYRLDFFLDMFIVSGIARQFENGNPKYLVGRSGGELVADVIDLVCDNPQYNETKENYFKPDENYWTGWVLAYYQWCTGKTFSEIKNIITMEQLRGLYNPYHEMDEEAVVNNINNRFKNQATINRLQMYRKLIGLSQSELAAEADVNLRTLQQYEIGAKDIRKASASTVLSLSRVLKCEPKDLCS